MSDCIDEKELERLALEPSTAVQAAWEHLVSCDRCRYIYRAFVEMERLGSVELPMPEVLATPGVVSILQPIFNHGGENRSRRLAAANAPKEERYIVHSFGNEEQSLVARIMQDRKNQEVTLFLLADDKRRACGQRVILTGTGLEAITDQEGAAHLGVQRVFRCPAIKVQAPLAVFDLAPLTREMATASQMHSFVLKNKQLDEINIEIENLANAQRYRITIKKMTASRSNELQVLAFTDRERTIVPQTNPAGVRIFEVESPERVLRIHIF